MQKQQEIIVYHTLRSMLREQADAAAAGKTSIETDDINTSGGESPFTPAETRFLGKFDAYGTPHMGIIYSVSDIGVREFIARSGKDLNLTPAILLRMLRDKIIKLVPYTGWGRDESYTIELQLPLEDIAGYGAEDEKKVEKGSDASGAPADAAAGDVAGPGPEIAWTIKYGDILSESAKIAKKLLSEKQHTNNVVHIEKSRILKKVPTQYVKHLEQLITMISKKKYSAAEKQRLIADILDNLFVNFKLNDKQIEKSYEMHKKQKRLHKFLNNK
jgi:hypothetical protein